VPQINAAWLTDGTANPEGSAFKKVDLFQRHGVLGSIKLFCTYVESGSWFAMWHQRKLHWLDPGRQYW
jgi:hypothetical protein